MYVGLAVVLDDTKLTSSWSIVPDERMMNWLMLNDTEFAESGANAMTFEV